MSDLQRIISAHVIDGCTVRVYADEGVGHIEVIQPFNLGNTIEFLGELGGDLSIYEEYGAEVIYAV